MPRKRRVGRGHLQPCHWCGRKMLNDPSIRQSHPLRVTVDHVQPKVQGGVDDGNTVLCCQTCNRVKGDLPPDVWETFMQTNPRWWEGSIRHGVWRER